MLRKPMTKQQQREYLEHEILKVRDDQRALQHQLEDAVTTEIRGLAAVDASRAIQTRCRRLIDEHAQAICSLQDELAALIPRQRPAAD